MRRRTSSHIRRRSSSVTVDDDDENDDVRGDVARPSTMSLPSSRSGCDRPSPTPSGGVVVVVSFPSNNDHIIASIGGHYYFFSPCILNPRPSARTTVVSGQRERASFYFCFCSGLFYVLVLAVCVFLFVVVPSRAFWIIYTTDAKK